MLNIREPNATGFPSSTTEFIRRTVSYNPCLANLVLQLYNFLYWHLFNHRTNHLEIFTRFTILILLIKVLNWSGEWYKLMGLKIECKLGTTCKTKNILNELMTFRTKKIASLCNSNTLKSTYIRTHLLLN